MMLKRPLAAGYRQPTCCQYPGEARERLVRHLTRRFPRPIGTAVVRHGHLTGEPGRGNGSEGHVDTGAYGLVLVETWHHGRHFDWRFGGGGIQVIASTTQVGAGGFYRSCGRVPINVEIGATGVD
jgi:hypothetical protein